MLALPTSSTEVFYLRNKARQLRLVANLHDRATSPDVLAIAEDLDAHAEALKQSEALHSVQTMRLSTRNPVAAVVFLVMLALISIYLMIAMGA